MKDNLNELSKQEFYLINELEKTEGSIEEKRQQCLILKIFSSYNEIFLKYSNLNNIEAFKRAIFIQWIAIIEPDIYSGIGSLNKVIEEQNLKKLDELAFNNLLDEEFKNMVSFYYSISDWYFENFKEIKKVVQQQQMSIKKNNSMFNRGQMGKYWNSLNKMDLN
jgi:hypothetical protein